MFVYKDLFKNVYKDDNYIKTNETEMLQVNEIDQKNYKLTALDARSDSPSNSHSDRTVFALFCER